MKRLSILLISCIAFVTTSCELFDKDGEYVKIGPFDTKLEAQNMALERVYERYDHLPANDTYYKLHYNFLQVSPETGTNQALWFNKKAKTLAFENEVQSGISCMWENVDKAMLARIVAGKNGARSVDSLARPSSLGNGQNCY